MSLESDILTDVIEAFAVRKARKVVFGVGEGK